MIICPYAKQKNTFENTFWCELTDSECIESVEVYEDCEEYQNEEGIMEEGPIEEDDE